ncbi:hypothetical protein [Methylomonas koyamae]|uniref:hypothetical protein n=1 Tax=Methylomonas koyamae TaxID=702114 RepID=UPI000AADBF71|nr:hypothetical protein [Methylomonas koyamae]
MTNKKIATGAGEPQAATKSFNDHQFNLIDYRIKAVIHHLAPWFFLVGGLHG